VPGGCATNTRASCAQSFPTKAAEGLLWVWPDGGAAADQEAAAAFWPGVAPELDQYGDAAYGSSHRWYYR
jgi:phenylpropionate dioxygenase-like ring-hydroxylating dioxygenase large terminal subunit